MRCCVTRIATAFAVAANGVRAQGSEDVLGVFGRFFCSVAFHGLHQTACPVTVEPSVSVVVLPRKSCEGTHGVVSATTVNGRWTGAWYVAPGGDRGGHLALRHTSMSSLPGLPQLALGFSINYCRGLTRGGPLEFHIPPQRPDPVAQQQRLRPPVTYVVAVAADDRVRFGPQFAGEGKRVVLPCPPTPRCEAVAPPVEKKVDPHPVRFK